MKVLKLLTVAISILGVGMIASIVVTYSVMLLPLPEDLMLFIQIVIMAFFGWFVLNPLMKSFDSKYSKF
jgi:hypothetical protein